MNVFIKSTTIIWGGILFFLMVSPAMSQPNKYFYHSDREIILEGTIQHSEEEPRYRGRAQFLIIHIKDKAAGEIFSVELCPEWFLDWDLQPGQQVKITGSVTRRGGELRHIIARKITFEDRIKELRDKYGFPNWRGRHRRR